MLHFVVFFFSFLRAAASALEPCCLARWVFVYQLFLGTTFLSNKWLIDWLVDWLIEILRPKVGHNHGGPVSQNMPFMAFQEKKIPKFCGDGYAISSTPLAVRRYLRSEYVMCFLGGNHSGLWLSPTLCLYNATYSRTSLNLKPAVYTTFHDGNIRLPFCASNKLLFC